MIRNDNPTYYLLNQTLVDPDVANKHREVLSESTVDVGGKKLITITFKQVLQDFGVRNWNGRIYGRDTVINAIRKNPLVQYDLKQGTWTGEYGHPLINKTMNEISRQMTIFPPNACWTINKYWEEGNLLMGECTTLADGYGEMVRDRILTNYPAMASSRAIGGVDKSGNVLPGYTIITYDCVIRPSHKTAYMDKNSVDINTFNIGTGSNMNTMSESAIQYDFTKDPSFSNFLMSESSSKTQINMLCDTFNLDVDTMEVGRRNITFKSITESGIQTIVIPINKLVNAEYYNLF